MSNTSDKIPHSLQLSLLAYTSALTISLHAFATALPSQLASYVPAGPQRSAYEFCGLSANIAPHRLRRVRPHIDPSRLLLNPLLSSDQATTISI